MYKQESQKIRDLLGNKITRIEHIGSTSIPGLVSKPIIHIAVEIANSENVDAIIGLLESLDYPKADTHKKDISTERHLLRKGIPTEFHLSICYRDKGSFLERQILFRDYLRQHSDTRDVYVVLKKEGIEKDPTGKGLYLDNKTDFVMSVLKKAGFQNKWFDLSKY